MSSLFLKDIVILRKERSMFFAVAVASSVPCIFPLNPLLGLFFSILPAYYVSGWACGLDFKYKADRFLCALPVPRTCIVAGRYFSLVAAWAAFFFMALPIWAILAVSGVSPPLLIFPAMAIVSASLTLIYHAVFLGAYYVLGYQSARWAVFVAFALIGAIGGGIGGLPSSSGELDILHATLAGSVPLAAYALMLGLGIILYALSFLLSAFAYSRKEF